MTTEKLFRDPDINLHSLSKKLEFTPNRLSQFLNEKMGINFNQYINRLRVQEAKEQLVCNEHLTIEAIGYESGFKSKSTFFAQFKKIVGTTPALYKKQREEL